MAVECCPRSGMRACPGARRIERCGFVQDFGGEDILAPMRDRFDFA